MIAPKLPRCLFARLGEEAAVRVAFSDESGTGNQEEERNTVVAAIMLNVDQQQPELEADLEELLRAQEIDPTKYELKGTRLARDIRAARTHPSEEHERRARAAKAIWQGTLALLYQHKVPIFAAAYNRPGYEYFCNQLSEPPSAEPPSTSQSTAYTSAFGDCLMQVDRYVNTTMPAEQVLWISDKAVEENNLKNVLKATRILLGRIPLSEIDPSLPEPHIAHIRPPIYFGHSHESRPLQVADLCATTLAYHLRGERDVKEFFPLLRAQFVNIISKPRFVEFDPRGFIDAIEEDLATMPVEERPRFIEAIKQFLESKKTNN